MSLDRLNAFLAEGDRSSMPSNWLEGQVEASRRGRYPHKARRPRSEPVKKPVRNVSYKYTPQQALAAGLWWASVAPKGHMVCAHRSQHTAEYYVKHVLRGAGCVVRPIQELL